MKYYSEILNKNFDSVEELEAAEKEKVEKTAKRKAEADEVKEAVTARVQAQIDARKAKNEAYKVYLQACEEADQKVREATKEERAKLKAFCEKHPEGYHDTIKIGDVTYKYSYNDNRYVDPFLRLLDSIF